LIDVQPYFRLPYQAFPEISEIQWAHSDDASF
jgi:hypothetical protein